MLVRRRMDDAQILAEASSMGSYPIKTAHSALVASLKSSNNVIYDHSYDTFQSIQDIPTPRERIFLYCSKNERKDQGFMFNF
jgi:hypothetical protein